MAELSSTSASALCTDYLVVVIDIDVFPVSKIYRILVFNFVRNAIKLTHNLSIASDIDKVDLNKSPKPAMH